MTHYPNEFSPPQALCYGLCITALWIAGFKGWLVAVGLG